jgi:hypothetical protein
MGALPAYRGWAITPCLLPHQGGEGWEGVTRLRDEHSCEEAA